MPLQGKLSYKENENLKKNLKSYPISAMFDNAFTQLMLYSVTAVTYTQLLL